MIFKREAIVMRKRILSLLMTVGMSLIIGNSAIFTAAAMEGSPEEEAVYLAFTGDQHGETETYREWIETMLDVYGEQLILLSYAGDICDKNWEQPVFDEFQSVLDELVPGRYNVTTGNQEFKQGAPGDHFGDLGEGFTRIGEVIKTDDYIVYDLGSAQEKLAVPQTDVDTLAAWLADAPFNIPIFILAHYPLHLAVQTEDHEIPGPDNYRQQANNAALIEVLNQHPNIIFLWGHNHTFQDPRYGTIRPAGSKYSYTIEDPTDKAEFSFIYANYGSFCRTDTYGIIARVLRTDDGVNVSLYYVDTDVPDKTKDSAEILITEDGSVTTQVTDGTEIDLEDILSMTGYPDDPAFYEEY